MNPDESFKISFEELEEAIKLMEKGKLPIVPNRLPSISIPKDLTPEHYWEMNLLPGQHRIGEEHRQRYLDTLSELHVNGYLTEEEFEKRADWVNAAQTSEQIDIAFIDLQRSLMALRAKEYIKADTQKNLTKSWFIGPAIVIIVVTICMILDGLNGAWIGVAILGGELAVFTAILGYRLGKHRGV